MNQARAMLLKDAIDRWVAYQRLIHVTETEKKLAWIMVEVAREMLDEAEAKIEEPKPEIGAINRCLSLVREIAEMPMNPDGVGDIQATDPYVTGYRNIIGRAREALDD